MRSQIKMTLIMRERYLVIYKNTPIKMKVMKKDVVMNVGSFSKKYLMI